MEDQSMDWTDLLGGTKCVAAVADDCWLVKVA